MYVAKVAASSKQQAIVKGAALASQLKMQREYLRLGRERYPETLLEPDVKIEPITVDEFDEDDVMSRRADSEDQREAGSPLERVHRARG